MSSYAVVNQQIEICPTASKTKDTPKVLKDLTTAFIHIIASVLLNIAAGAVFGAALLGSGVHRPCVILSQLLLNDFHMLSVFLGASACSVIIVAAAQHFGYLKPDTKKSSFCSWLGYSYGNVITGGIMVGVGMAVTGACPGTAFVQAGAGIPSGRFVILGGLLGAGLFTAAGPRLRNIGRDKRARSPSPAARTIPEKFAIDRKKIILAYEIACLSFIAITSVLRSSAGAPSMVHPVYGGLLLGLAQAVSVFLRSKTIGVSVAYEDLTRLILPGNMSSRRDFQSRFTPATQFALGMYLGSAAAAGSAPAAPDHQQIPKQAAVLGGVIMVFGARLAGGCPSGHGISGMASFSIASTLAVASMFSGGIFTALLLGMVRFDF